MKISAKKRIAKGVGLVGASVAVLGAVLPTLDIFADADSVMTPTFGGESNNNIRNPDRGFYFPIYVDGSNLDTFDQNAFSSNLAAMSQSYPYMSIIQVNINAAEIIGLVENRTISFHHISDSRLQNLEKIFTAIRNNGFKAIVNFDAITYDGMNSSYKMKLDYNGYGFETAFMADMVETAIKDITPILVANDDIIMMTSDGCSGSDFSQDEYSSMYRKLYVSSTWREDQYKTLTTSATSISDQVTLASVKAMAEDYVKADRELVTRATMSQLRPDNAGNTAWKDDGWLATYTPWSLTMCKDGQFEDDCICIDDTNNQLWIVEQLQLKSAINKHAMPTTMSIQRFSPTLRLRFKRESLSMPETAEISIDFSLYELISDMKEGYRPTVQDKNIHADFVSFVQKVIEFGNKESRIILIPKESDKDYKMIFEETDFGYEFKVV